MNKESSTGQGNTVGDNRAKAGRDGRIEVSVVMPCLNEAETVATCVRKALSCLDEAGLSGEVVIADNGSEDGSQRLASEAGARVVQVERKGYGAALIGGIEQSRGDYVIMGDADDSYDFTNLEPFVEKLREGYDLVMGNRFRGGIEPGAMPWHHRYFGNPALTKVLNLFFRTGINDAHCGLRGFSKEAYDQMNLRTTGMEFASEMVVKSAAHGLRIAEIPTTLSPDGRSGEPHLRSFRDGWRHLRFLMLLAPDWLLFAPGAVMFTVGLILLGVLWAGQVEIAGVVFDVHTMLLSALLTVVGYQAITVGIASRIFAVEEEVGPPSDWLLRGYRHLNLERGLLIGAAICVGGLALVGAVAWDWAAASFGNLQVQETLRPVVTGVTLITLGVQTLLMSLFYSMLGLKRRN